MSKKNKAGESEKNCSLSFMSGLACGLFVAFLVYLWSSTLPDPFDLISMIKNKTLSSDKAEAINGKPLESSDGLSYPTFYKYLPGEDIPIPLLKPKSKKDANLGPEEVYLQVGSFNEFREADGQKARLALLGILASIESRKGRGDSFWYRVKIGPLSKSAARDLKARLEKEDFDVLVLVKNG